MTTDPIAAARALIEPLTGYTTGPWDLTTVDHSSGGGGAVPSTLFRVGFVSHKDYTGHCADACHGDSSDNARLIAAAPDLRDMVATLADALEAERADAEKWREAAGAHHVAAMREAEKWIAVSVERDGLRAELAKTLLQTGDLKIALAGAQAQVAAAYEAAAELVVLDHVCDSIRALAPSDAQAALDKLLEEARLEGWRAGRDAAAQEAEDWFYDPQADEVTDYRLSLNIRMMPEPQEASPAGRSEADARRRYAVQLLHQAVDLAMSQAEGRA